MSLATPSAGAAPDRLAGLPPLRETLAKLGLTADKRFGQHFLLDLNICRKIARLAGPLNDQVVVEVGPGPGGLTRALLEAGARVITVEKDTRFTPVLEELAEVFPGRLTALNADALSLDESAMLAKANDGDGARVVSNLPYNVGTALLLKWLLGPWRPQGMTLMFQKEVALRIVATAGGSDYGRLSVIAQTLCDARLVMDLPARAFTPPPKVSSAVINLRRRNERPDDALIAALETVTGAAFGQRRKMLRSALRSLGGEQLCLEAGVDANARAETIPVPGFLSLARAWVSQTALTR